MVRQTVVGPWALDKYIFFERDSNNDLLVRAREDSSCLRTLGHCDGPDLLLQVLKRSC
jgi:hypothetical protein